ncbi:demethylmenaquinone methyltransferase / 2-methoxy-6-polyprenyl-1,4-benzoquinol methylase [Rubritalea squalenifaciens DSM 18772]|uniref:Demethylmenaquinone methyltransferase / 2-methoxy-6-polyprenyl-1,4-benzoquinol methylase n=1 Tax=Rubritalea squalenifaciens DSM 18772 TaxID=1123071 RepID=A0A1M6CTC7_9BACT|nr:class I SAM-dependent methyltransferase [Rubritalea squalenifaciens]SHI64210.1 demethylmenaquinone methyltransferase / 2-methoxy-6-polyprenyl-1,4-benzoquinol methylase [Rubritalea squalenifaciens DSM 18772]
MCQGLEDPEVDIHSERFVKSLFSEMSRTYGVVNLLSSLGFAYFWRKLAVRALPKDSLQVCDLMTGGAECLTHMRTHFGKETRMELVDWCEDMCARARQTVRRYHGKQVEVINASALALPSQDASYDAVVSTFGLKTLSPDELLDFVREVKRVLKPGGSISLLEFSMPENAMVRFFFRLYVKFYVPFLGWLFLGESGQLPDAVAIHQGVWELQKGRPAV